MTSNTVGRAPCHLARARAWLNAWSELGEQSTGHKMFLIIGLDYRLTCVHYRAEPRSVLSPFGHRPHDTRGILM
jgi:hypothetical protein